MEKLSVIVLTKNEEKNIAECLKTVFFADEIILIDDYSTDRTCEIAKKYGVRIYKRKLDDFASQRNYGLSKAKNEWVLFVDADERVTKELKEEILEKLRNYPPSSRLRLAGEITRLRQDFGGRARLRNSAVGYRIPRKNQIFGKFLKYSDWYPDYRLHFFRKNKGRWERKVHERTVVEGKVGKLRNSLTHYNYQTIEQFIKRDVLHYAEKEAEILRESGYHFVWTDLFRKPLSVFLGRLFLKKGYKDGLHGLVASALTAFATFTIYARLWQYEGFKEVEQKEFLKKVIQEFERAMKEIKYWLKESQIKEEKNSLKKFLFKIFR